ncbi:MAG: isoprenylcysteine carboxylmethyltransferase family protein [Rhodospirillaceae bacterium]|nr:isoprenylcysteine carboxylmethyltransferase family protein [Rhodospirillaceae bacterium]MBT3928512.1 isoprenylcysteine carboxylmethyltransferase family protein [Rhodospirillaceae bacterium]MBT4426762.1 isoprenylcysteine carboxylmethyltransferase family protein [Rhodospirillaceae bacterium]MBT5039217.1 isoprenylcysteine carboxylmethyltransferase family protein [Rhodospirillaceae bacterium]MBT6829879.1 isoprenylcysteine carboxylmethyltransferase family protein [Rhodospirillaceae bacterium]
MAKAKSDSSGAIAPPPLIALALVALGVALGVLWPVELIPAPWQYIAGGVIIAASLLLVASAFRLFRRARTPVPTYRTPTALVTDGVYTLTRNPIYLSMMLLMIGLAVTLDNIWLLALAAIFQQIIRWGVIAREERYLSAKFGQDYRAFKQRTRRWI